MAGMDSLKDMNGLKIALIGVIGAAVVAALIFVATQISTPAMAPLYTGLSIEDSSKIVSELEKANIPFEIQANGSEVLVPSSRVLRLRMTMAEKGLPSGGSIVGYEIFDRSETLGTSSFVVNINMVRALEGELARTIGSFSQIESARVHLVVPKPELFTRQKENPSASVALKLRHSMELSKSEISSITHFVAAAVPGLKPDRVTVVDSFGRLLARGDGDKGGEAMAGAAEEYRTNLENRMRDTLEGLLEKVVGPGKVKVQVAADVNFDRIVTNSEKFDPEGQVVRSVQSTSEKEDSQDKAGKESVSAANNLPASAAGAEGGNSSNRATDRNDETTNYEISKVVQNHVKEGGNINRISVAVLVDGTYGEEGADGKPTYTPRTEEELKQLQTLVRSAIGYEEKRGDKIEVVNMRFTKIAEVVEEESLLSRLKGDLRGLIQPLIYALLAILFIFTVLRPIAMQVSKQLAAASERAQAEMAALEGASNAVRLPGGAMAGGGGFAMPGSGGGGGGSSGDDKMIDVANIKGSIRSSSMKAINDIVEKYPDETMGVLRQWLMKS